MAPIRIGVLGGGQLGRMLGLAGIPLGARFTFFDPNPDSPAGAVGELITGEYSDREALQRFIDKVDIVTYEFENVPVDVAEFVEKQRPVWPPPAVLDTAQDRLNEKEFFNSVKIPTAPYHAVDSLEDLHRAVDTIGLPGVLKTRRLGYDGKGQARLHDKSDVDAAWNELGSSPLIYEGFVDFSRELSILGVRNVNGEVRCYPLVENMHSEGILRMSLAPAPDVSTSVQKMAEDYVVRVLNEFSYVGVIAIELFETDKGLIANEMAPRVHNSGHWTIEGSEVSQFENHIRAVAGFPLGDTAMVGGEAVMLNIIGQLPSESAVLSVPDTHLHLYDKSEAPRRKLGHITARIKVPGTANERLQSLRRAMSTPPVSSSS